MSLQLEIDRVLWSLPAEFNIYQVAQLKLELEAALAHRLPIDCRLDEVEEIDCAALQLLLVGQTEASRAGQLLRVCSHSAASREAVATMGCATLLGAPA
jgi:anti-anti-sigma regulatory factor